MSAKDCRMVILTGTMFILTGAAGVATAWVILGVGLDAALLVARFPVAYAFGRIAAWGVAGLFAVASLWFAGMGAWWIFIAAREYAASRPFAAKQARAHEASLR